MMRACACRHAVGSLWVFWSHIRIHLGTQECSAYKADVVPPPLQGMFENIDPMIVADVAGHYDYNADSALKAIMDIQVGHAGSLFIYICQACMCSG